MAEVSIENIGKIGLIQDRLPQDLPPEAWSYARNIRFTGSAAQKFKGYVSVFSGIVVQPLHILPWVTDVTAYWMYMSGARIYTVTGSTHANITRYVTIPGDNDYSGNADTIWSGGVFGSVPVLNNNTTLDPPQQWDNSLGRMKDLANWPANTYAATIGFFKNFILAMNVTEGGTAYPQVIRWSHPADPGTVPSSWDYTLPTTDAGRVTLSETGGAVLAAKVLGDINVIYKEDAVIGMQYVGGQNIFRFWTMFSDFGLFNSRCATEFYRKHFLITERDVLVHNGQTAESIIDDKNRDYLFRNIDAAKKNHVFVAANRRESEIWICFPNLTASDVFANEALVWNWVDNTWGHRDIPNISVAEFGVVTPIASSQLIDNYTNTFDSYTDAIDITTYSAVNRRMLMASGVNNKLYTVDETNTADGINEIVILERLGLALAGQDRFGNPKADFSRVKFIRAVYPKLRANGAVTIRIGVQQQAGGAVTWSVAQDFNPAIDKKISCRLRGVFICFRIESEIDVEWELYGYTLDLDLIGRAVR